MAPGTHTGTLTILAAVVSALIVFAVAIRYRGWRLAATMGVVTLVAVYWLLAGARNKPKNRGQMPADAVGPQSLAQIADHIPAQAPADGYITSLSCAECHKHQHETWHASYHRTMTQQATPVAVIGDFANKHVEFEGVAYELSRRGDEFWVKVTLPAAGKAALQTIERPIALTTGSHHMQVYWIPTGTGRTVAELPIYFLKEDRRWVPRDASFLKPPDPDPGSPGIGRWNRECIACHTTHGRSRPRADGSLAADSLVAEFGIACEACHGAGEQHVKARRGEPVEDTIVNPAALSSQRSAQVCGRCHCITLPKRQSDLADLFENGYRFRPGDALSDTLHIVRRDQATRDRFKDGILQNDRQIERAFDLQFWRDGQVRVSGREFNGLFETACYQKGELACVSCHVLHKPTDDARPVETWADDQLKAEGVGDAACTQCHPRGQYATESHTHHEDASSGSLCYNCHMPHTTYGLLKAIRSHTIDSPNASASIEVGRPNACNLCHLDQTLAWTARRLEQWYSIVPPALDDDQHRVSAAVLWALAGDAGQRALAAWHMGWEPAVGASGTNWLPPYLATLLNDPYPAVRHIARRSLRKLRAFNDFDYDFVGPPGEVDAAVQKALVIWQKSQSKPLAEFPGSVLISPDGTLKQDTFDRLKANRDDKPVSLAE